MSHLGGLKITNLEWIGPTSLLVGFSSTYGTTKHYQLYAGRTLIGTSETTGGRTLIAQLQPNLHPQKLTLMAVGPGYRTTDYGDDLPPGPYNRFKLAITTSSWPTDSKFIDITAGTTAGGAVDSSNRIGRILYDKDRQYIFETDSYATGTWNFEATGVDNRKAAGNTGTAIAFSGVSLAQPSDVALNSDGTRFTASISGGTLSVSFDSPFV